jgi:hypothetical protein
MTKRPALRVALRVLSMFLAFIGVVDLCAGIALLTLPIPSHGWSGMQYLLAGLLYFIVGMLLAKWNSRSDLADGRES